MAGQRNSETKNSPSKVLPTSIALFTLLYNALLALACQSILPSDPLSIGLSISLYAFAGSALSLLALFGIHTNRPTLLTPLTHYLFLDTLISFLLRVLVLQLLVESYTDESFCFDEPTWSPRNFRHDIVTSVRWQKWRLAHAKSCKMALDVVNLGLVGVLVGLAVLQGCAAMRLRAFGKEMELQMSRVEEKAVASDTEKGFVEKAKLVDL